MEFIVTIWSVIQRLWSAISFFPFWINLILAFLFNKEFKSFTIFHPITDIFTLILSFFTESLDITSYYATYDMFISRYTDTTNLSCTIEAIFFIFTIMVETYSLITSARSLVNSLFTIFIKMVWIMMMMLDWITSTFMNPFC